MAGLVAGIDWPRPIPGPLRGLGPAGGVRHVDRPEEMDVYELDLSGRRCVALVARVIAEREHRLMRQELALRRHGIGTGTEPRATGHGPGRNTAG